MAIDAISRYPMLRLMHASIPPFAALSSFSFCLVVAAAHSLGSFQYFLHPDLAQITLQLPHRDIRVRATFHQRLVVTWRMWPMDDDELKLSSLVNYKPKFTAVLQQHRGEKHCRRWFLFLSESSPSHRTGAIIAVHAMDAHSDSMLVQLKFVMAFRTSSRKPRFQTFCRLWWSFTIFQV